MCGICASICCWIRQVYLTCIQILSKLMSICMWERFSVCESYNGVIGHLLQVVTCELGKWVGSMIRELGFTTLTLRSKETRMCFWPSTSLFFRLPVSSPPFPVFVFVTWLSGMLGTQPPFSSSSGSWDACIPSSPSFLPFLSPHPLPFLWCYRPCFLDWNK